MAAVAAEPEAAAIPTTPTGALSDEDLVDVAKEIPSVSLECEDRPECGPTQEPLSPQVDDGGEEEQHRHVRPELEYTAGKDLSEEVISDCSVERASLERFSSPLLGDHEGGGGNVSNQYHSILSDPQPSAVFLHSLPAAPPVTEAGLSLAEPAVPTTNVTTDRAETVGRDRGYAVRVLNEQSSGPVDKTKLDGSVPVSLESIPGFDQKTSGNDELTGRGLKDSIPKRRQVTDSVTLDELSQLQAPEHGLSALSPGSEVRVCLDHVIDDALVVSFRLGKKVFSGVLMDVSRRFGPYGIPITIFPRRDDHGRSQVSLKMEPVADNNPSIEQEMSTPPPHSWAPKPPPLFQEGAPYPPPLLIRDTYNQALPQPLPRKIKRPKRRYRCEEPTSIMNAIKLRPRQVLCDKCKGVVSSVAHRDARRGPVDLRADEPSRRRKAVDGPISTEVKRLRNDDRGRGITDRRAPSGICLSSSSTSRRVLRGTVSSSSSRHTSLKLNSRKPLDKSNPSESSKVSVIKLARSPQKLATHQHNQDHTRVVTRAATSQNHNQKVHFTRRLQQLSSSPGASNSSHTVALPPRMRLKPQRYRTEESQAPSSCSSFLTRHITRSSPPKPFSSPALTSDPDPTTEFLSCDPHVEVLPHREVGADGPPSSLCLDSSRSECSTTGTPEALPPENPSSLPPPQSPLSSSSFLVPEGHTSCPLTPRSHSKELQAPGEEDEEEGGELKRRPPL